MHQHLKIFNKHYKAITNKIFDNGNWFMNKVFKCFINGSVVNNKELKHVELTIIYHY